MIKYLPHLFIYSFFFLYALVLPLAAQEIEEADSLYIVKMRDGNVFIGRILERDPEKVILQTDYFGDLHIPARHFRKIRAAGSGHFVRGQYWRHHRYAAHYFLTPSGFSLPRGSGYYQNNWGLLNQFNYGFTDRFTLKLGFIPYSLVDNYKPTNVLINPQFSFSAPTKKSKWSGGALLAGSFGNRGEIGGISPVGIVYGAFTLGSRDRRFTATLGYGYDGVNRAGLPAAGLAATVRLGSRFYLMTDNYYLAFDYEPLLLTSLGVRYAVRAFAFDVVLLLEQNQFSDNRALWLGLVLPFGRVP